MESRRDIRLSFVIPVRDDADRLRRCLESIRRAARARTDIEVTVVDNESKDESVEVAREQGAAVLVSNGRVAALRNLGARHAAGELLAFVDADHEISDGWLDAALTALERADVVAAGAPYHSPPHANWVQRQYDAFRARSREPHETDWLGSGNLVVRRDAFDRIGGFDVTIETCEDVDLCTRLAAGGGRLVSDPRLASIHFGDPASLRALFLGEIWRGRDNLRVTLRGPITARRLRSLLVPAVDLLCLASAVVALGARAFVLGSALASVVVALAGVRATVMVRRQRSIGAATMAQALVVAAVYDTARALALAARGSHRVRRAFEDGVHATDSGS